jgi:hypothetical protein
VPPAFLRWSVAAAPGCPLASALNGTPWRELVALNDPALELLPNHYDPAHEDGLGIVDSSAEVAVDIGAAGAIGWRRPQTGSRQNHSCLWAIG